MLGEVRFLDATAWERLVGIGCSGGVKWAEGIAGGSSAPEAASRLSGYRIIEAATDHFSLNRMRCWRPQEGYVGVFRNVLEAAMRVDVPRGKEMVGVGSTIVVIANLRSVLMGHPRLLSVVLFFRTKMQGCRSAV